MASTLLIQEVEQMRQGHESVIQLTPTDLYKTSTKAQGSFFSGNKLQLTCS